MPEPRPRYDRRDLRDAGGVDSPGGLHRAEGAGELQKNVGSVPGQEVKRLFVPLHRKVQGGPFGWGEAFFFFCRSAGSVRAAWRGFSVGEVAVRAAGLIGVGAGPSDGRERYGPPVVCACVILSAPPVMVLMGVMVG